jgi:Amt family ammonium transporter
MAGNGVLAGLVAVCSGVGSFGMIPALVTGGVAGVLVVFSVLGIERVLKVDDPVGASSVHAVCGFWGLVATGLMATDDGLLAGGGADLLVTQVIGGLAIAAFVAVAAGALFFGLKAAGLLRVSAEDEILGLDLSEHGAPGYGPELLTASTSTGSASELAMS